MHRSFVSMAHMGNGGAFNFSTFKVLLKAQVCSEVPAKGTVVPATDLNGEQQKKKQKIRGI